MKRNQMAFVEKLARFMPLSDEAKDAVSSCVGNTVTMPPRTQLVRQGDKYSGTFFLHEGWAVRQKVLRDGRRQVMNFLMGGDAVGFAANFYEEADHSVVALTDISYSPVDADRLLEMMAAYPKVGAAMFWSIALEEAVLRERVGGLGQRSARGHMAHIITELVMRQRNFGADDRTALLLPVTQVLLSDALGISPVHTNRTIRRLVHDQLIETSPLGLRVLNERRLAEIGDFDGQFLHILEGD